MGRGNSRRASTPDMVAASCKGVVAWRVGPTDEETESTTEPTSPNRLAPETENTVAFRFAVTSPDGDIFETSNVGETVRLAGNRPFRVTADRGGKRSTYPPPFVLVRFSPWRSADSERRALADLVPVDDVSSRLAGQLG